MQSHLYAGGIAMGLAKTLRDGEEGGTHLLDVEPPFVSQVLMRKSEEVILCNSTSGRETNIGCSGCQEAGYCRRGMEQMHALPDLTQCASNPRT